LHRHVYIIGGALNAAVAAIAHAERRGGDLLVKLGGRLRPLRVSRADRQRWCAAAARSAKAFEAKLQRDVAKAVARISGDGEDATVEKVTPSRPPTSSRSPAKRSRVASPPPPRVNKVSDWHTEADGSLTRTVTTENDAAAAHADAA
jgi:hypothetical protein